MKITKKGLKGLGVKATLILSMIGCTMSPPPVPEPPAPGIDKIYNIPIGQQYNLKRDFAGLNDAILFVDEYKITYQTTYQDRSRVTTMDLIRNTVLREADINDTTRVVLDKYKMGEDYYPHKYDPFTLITGRVSDDLEERLDLMDEPNKEIKRVYDVINLWNPDIATQFTN